MPPAKPFMAAVVSEPLAMSNLRVRWKYGCSGTVTDFL